jgi:phosphoribosylamine--glycine ligase
VHLCPSDTLPSELLGQEDRSRVRRQQLNSQFFEYSSQLDQRVSASLGTGSFPQSTGHRVLLVGGGGREHCLAEHLCLSPRIAHLFVYPGNYGTGRPRPGRLCPCENVPPSALAAAASNEEVLAFCLLRDVSLVVVGPEQPLVDGLSDALRAGGVACFGPSKAASVLESSKAWSKEFMARNGIPTAAYRVFADFSLAKEYLLSLSAGARVVVKASGIAAGKGVLIPDSIEEAIEGAQQMLEGNVFGAAGSEIVIEQFIEGEEVSVLAFCDGSTAIGMPPAQVAFSECKNTSESK